MNPTGTPQPGPQPGQPVPPAQPQQPVQPVQRVVAQPAQPVQPMPSVRPTQQPVLVSPVPQQVVPVQPVAAPAPAVVAEGPDTDAEYDDDPSDASAAVTWTAHEYIHQEKGVLWFTLFALIIIALIAVSLLLMQSISFAALLAVIALVVIVYSRRPPRELTYTLNDNGLVIDEKLHKFSDFKSFGIIRDGEDFSVMLIPTQRFQPGITVYFPEESGEAIVDMLGARLPMKDLHLDAVDRVVRLLRL